GEPVSLRGINVGLFDERFARRKHSRFLEHAGDVGRRHRTLECGTEDAYRIWGGRITDAMTHDQFTIGLVQMSCSADKAANMAKAEAAIAEAAKRGAQIVCLPELFLGPYFCQK